MTSTQQQKVLDDRYEEILKIIKRMDRSLYFELKRNEKEIPCQTTKPKKVR